MFKVMVGEISCTDDSTKIGFCVIRLGFGLLVLGKQKTGPVTC